MSLAVCALPRDVLQLTIYHESLSSPTAFPQDLTVFSYDFNIFNVVEKETIIAFSSVNSEKVSSVTNSIGVRSQLVPIYSNDVIPGPGENVHEVYSLTRAYPDPVVAFSADDLNRI